MTSSSTAVDDASILRYLCSRHSHKANTTATFFEQLYASPPSCLAIFRLLPPLAKHVILRLLMGTLPPDSPAAVAMPLRALRCWVSSSSSNDGDGNNNDLLLSAALIDCLRLQILSLVSPPPPSAAASGFSDASEQQQQQLLLQLLSNPASNSNAGVTLHPVFQKQLLSALTGSVIVGASLVSSPNCFGELHPNLRKQPASVLDKYTVEKWEDILLFMVGSPSACPAGAVIKLLEKRGLMNPTNEKSRLEISHLGFKFLLQSTHAQVWCLLLQYIQIAPSLGMLEYDVLNFLFLLSSLELGVAYSIDALSDTEKKVLCDLGHIGIAMVKMKKGLFLPTRFATSLTSGRTLLGPLTDARSEGFAIVETNFRIYAYTSSKLQISIIRLFAEITTQFPNFVMGIITSATMEAAFRKGITADQIIAYLQDNAHPLMRKNASLSTSSILPMTVMDQLRLWERNLNRVEITMSRLVMNFAGNEDYIELKTYASEIGGLIFSDDVNHRLVISDLQYARIRERISEVRNIRRSGGNALPAQSVAAHGKRAI